MQTVELTNGKSALVMNIKHFITDETMIKSITELVFNRILDLSENKSSIITEVRHLLYTQGRSVYNDWYEDTGNTELINKIYETVIPFVKQMFPEYYKQTNKQ